MKIKYLVGDCVQLKKGLKGQLFIITKEIAPNLFSVKTTFSGDEFKPNANIFKDTRNRSKHNEN